MTKVEIAGQSYYVDGILKQNLDRVKEFIRKDWDYLYVVDGEVGAGKSVFTQQLAHYCSDGKISMSQMCFNPKEFKKAVLTSEPYGAIIFDEAFRGLSARAALTETNKMLVAMLQEIRQKNLFVFIVLPSIWDLDKYVSCHRCKGLFQVYTDEKRTRGFFKYYKKSVLMSWLSNYSNKYKYPPYPQFKGRFTNYYPLGKDEYKAKKAGSLGDYGYQKSGEKKESQHERLAKMWKGRYMELVRYAKEISGLSMKAICNELGHNYTTVKNWGGTSAHKPSINLEKDGFLPQTKEDLTKH